MFRLNQTRAPVLFECFSTALMDRIGMPLDYVHVKFGRNRLGWIHSEFEEVKSKHTRCISWDSGID